jgi:hypothetical protein
VSLLFAKIYYVRNGYLRKMGFVVRPDFQVHDA